MPHETPAEARKRRQEEARQTEVPPPLSSVPGVPDLPPVNTIVDRTPPPIKEGIFQREETGRASGVAVGGRTFLGLGPEDVARIQQQQGLTEPLSTFAEQAELRRQQEETEGTRPREVQIVDPTSIDFRSTPKLLRESFASTAKALVGLETELGKMREERRRGVLAERIAELSTLTLKLIPFDIGEGLVEIIGIADPEEIIRNFEQKLEPYTQQPTRIVNQFRINLLTKDEALKELDIISNEVNAIESRVQQELIKSPRLVNEGVAQPIQSDLLDARTEVFDAKEIINSVLGVQ